MTRSNAGPPKVCSPKMCLSNMWLLLLLVSAFTAQGCAFFESAGEVTLGKGQIPRVTEELAWPDIDEMTGSALAGRVGSRNDGPLINGAPTTLKKGTLAHVQGILSLAGDCQRVFRKAQLTDDDTKSVKNLAVRVTNCTGDARCAYLCGDFRGLEMEAAVEIELFDEEDAKKLAKQLADASPEAAVEAIVQIRLQFFKLELYQTGDDGKRENVTDRLSLFDLILTETGVQRSVAEIVALEAERDAALRKAEEDGTEFDPSPWATLPSWVKVLDRRYVTDIGATPKGERYEIDPSSALLKSIKQTVVKGESTSLRLVQRIRVERPDLYDLRFDGAGFSIDVQPEVVVSVLQLIKNLGTGAGSE
ncbi:MAG: hypothetical protein KC502_16015 [Myxococcales bacterium]|nr:hypothetical protein [Myxococcales bacterium]